MCCNLSVSIAFYHDLEARPVVTLLVCSLLHSDSDTHYGLHVARFVCNHPVQNYGAH